ncbi:MAG: response regulator [Rudaea sp.]
MATETHTANVLIADDDPVTLGFFQATLQQLGCRTVAVSSGSEALSAARRGRFDLFVLDRRMPDIGGHQLLIKLRRESIRTPAIATSADVNPEAIQELTDCGFQAVIAKPLSCEQLRAALQRFLPGIPNFTATGGSARSFLDDESALAASGGNRDIMQKLRCLLVAELEQLPNELERHRTHANKSTLREFLHRLRASCGFCGASALARATVRFDDALRESPQDTDLALTDLLRICAQTLDELQRHGAALPAGT